MKSKPQIEFFYIQSINALFIIGIGNMKGNFKDDRQSVKKTSLHCE